MDTRSLTSSEDDFLRREWLARFRIGAALLGGIAVLAAGAGLKTKESLYYILACVPAVFSGISWVKVGKMISDLDARIVQMLTGSVMRNESGRGSALFRHGAENLISALWWVARGDVVSVRLIGKGFSRRVLVARDTFQQLRDGELVKAEILPRSRVAVSVRHQKLGGD